MHDPRIDKLNLEIREHEEWLQDHPNHHTDDKVQVRLSLINKTLTRDQLLTAQLQEIANNQNTI